MMKFALPLLVLVFLDFGCTHDNGSNPSNFGQGNFDQEKKVNSGGWNPGTACTTPPSQHTDIDLDEQYIDGGYFDKDRKLVGDLKSDSYFCGHDRSTDWTKLPEVALVIGNQEGLDHFYELIRFLNRSWLSATSGSHRHGCIYFASNANFKRLANRTNIERIVIYGHGASGNSADAISGAPIDPEQLPDFQTSTLREVHFFSCQAGRKIQAWERVFKAHSPQANLDLSQDDIPVYDSLKEISDLMSNIWMCQI